MVLGRILRFLYPRYAVDCLWIPSGEGVVCSTCGVWRPFPRHRNCAVGGNDWRSRLWRTKKLAKLILLVRYEQAMINWASSGFRMRSKKEVSRLYSICTSCDKFNDDKCTACGCRVAPSVLPIRSKLKLKSEKCPLGKW